MRGLGLGLVGLLTLGCGRSEAPPAPTAAAGSAVPSAAVSEAPVPPALRALWRESVKYRRAHETLASNAPSKAKDVARVTRMLESAKALTQIPVVADVAADGKLVEARLKLLAESLDKGRATVRVQPAPGKPALPASARTDVGFEYTQAQVLGAHPFRIYVPGGEAGGARFVQRLGEVERLVIVTSARLEEGMALVSGRVPFFWDHAPVRFTRAPVDVAAKLARAGGDPATLTGRSAKVAAEIRANFAAVQALQAPLAEALAHEARGKLDLSRLNAWKAQRAAFKAAGWSAVYQKTK